MSVSADGSYAVPVSGPSPRLAMLRTIYLKALGVARAAWAKTRLALSTAVRLPRQVATAAVSMLSTGGGYDAAVHAVAGALRGAWGFAAGWSAPRLAAPLGRERARAAPRPHLPAARRSARGWTSRLLRPLRNAATRVARTVEAAATAAESLAGMPLVRAATTTAAKVGGGILLVHAATRGAAAAKVVSLLPGAMTVVVHATNPWLVLAASPQSPPAASRWPWSGCSPPAARRSRTRTRGDCTLRGRASP